MIDGVNPVGQDAWVARIGPNAAATMRRASNMLWVMLGSLIVLYAVFWAASTLFPRNSDAWNWYGLIGTAAFMLTGCLTWIPFSRIRARACREAAVYITLPRKTGESTLPAAALKSITMFDNLMWSRGVSPEGRYVPQPSKTWVGNSTGRFGAGKMH